MIKKKQIVYISLFVISVIGVIVCIVLSALMGNKGEQQEISVSTTNAQNINSTKNTINTQERKADLVIDGIGNLYFIPTADHEKLRESLSLYLTENGIIPNGALTQVGDIVPDEQGKYFTFYLRMNTQKKEVYLKGTYSLNTKTYIYMPENDVNNIILANNTSNIGVDAQEAPEVEFLDAPVNVSGLEGLNVVLTTEQIESLKLELTSFLNGNHELRRELLIDGTSIKEDNGRVTFTCVFVLERHDKKNIKVEHEGDRGFTLKLN